MTEPQDLPRPAPVIMKADDAVGELQGWAEDTESGEEAAVRVVDEPPGLTYDDEPGYVVNGERGPDGL